MTSSSTSRPGPTAPPAPTRFVSRTATARRRSSSDTRTHHGASDRVERAAARARRSGHRDGLRGRRSGAVDPAAATLMEQPTRTARSAAEEALLDAAERLLVQVGYARITTRRLADEAGVNHGLVHYYFGSNENL